MDALLEHLDSKDGWRDLQREVTDTSSLFIFAFSKIFPAHLAFCKSWQSCNNDFEAHLVALVLWVPYCHIQYIM